MGQALIMEGREVFGTFVMLHVGNILCFELMRGRVTSRVLGSKLTAVLDGRAEEPSKAGHQICTALIMRFSKEHIFI